MDRKIYVFFKKKALETNHKFIFSKNNPKLQKTFHPKKLFYNIFYVHKKKEPYFIKKVYFTTTYIPNSTNLCPLTITANKFATTSTTIFLKSTSINNIPVKRSVFLQHIHILDVWTKLIVIFVEK